MKRNIRKLASFLLICVLIWGTTGGWPVAAQSGGGTFFNAVTLNGDLDIYGTGVIRDSLDNTVRTQVTSGGVTVRGEATSPSIYGGYNGNAVSAGVQGSFIGAGGTGNVENWLLGLNTISGNYAGIVSGTGNNVTGDHSAIGGGMGNRVLSGAGYATIGGGATNSVSGSNSTVSGGYSNAIIGTSNAIGGGSSNHVTGGLATIGGGYYNYTGVGSGHAILGGMYNTIGTGRTGWYGGAIEGSRLEHKWPYSFLNDMNGPSYGDYSAIVGGAYNAIGDPYSFIGSGWENWIAGQYTRTLEGAYQIVQTGGCITDTVTFSCPGTFNTIVGGHWNEISNAYVDVEEWGGGTTLCQVDGYGFIGGGFTNVITGTLAQGAAITGGVSNTITSTYGAIGGGSTNQVTGLYGTVPGGASNVAAGAYSLAAGQQAQALHDGAFVWADSGATVFASTVANSFNVRASGGVHLSTAGAGLALDGPIIVDGMTFTYTEPITIPGVLTNVRLLYTQLP